MSGKFMKILKIAIPTLTLVLIASQLLNSCAVSQSELLKMYERQQAIEIEVAYPENQEQGTEKQLNWTELAFLTNYPEFREVFDSTLGIVKTDDGKQGIVYFDFSGDHTNNSTLRYAFANQKFHDNFWANSANLSILADAVQNTYTDLSGGAMIQSAIINAYFNIFPDAEPNYFNGNQTLTRGEYLAGLFRANNPVSDISSTLEFTASVDPAGLDPNTDFAYQLEQYSYLTLEDRSLNSSTFQGTITRAEAVYTIVKMFYADEYRQASGSSSSYADAVNGWDIASEAGFKDKKTKETKDYWKSYELSYALQNPDKGMPLDLYRALVVAKNHGLIAGENSRWDEGLTKSEAITLFARVFDDLGVQYSKDIDNHVATPTPTPGVTEIPQETKAPISESDFYYDTDGKLQYTIDLIDFIKGMPNFSDLDNDQICKIIESQDFEGIMKTGKAINDIEGHLHKKLSDRALSEYIKNSVLGSLIDTPVEDTNKGGSDENEKIEDYEEPAIDFDDKVDYTPSSGETDNTGSNEDSNETPSDDYSSLGEDKYKPQNPEVEIENEPEVEDAVHYTYTIINQWMFVTDNANTRLGPSTDFDLAGSVTKGKEVNVGTRCNETGWYTIINNGRLEFIAPQFISETAPSTPTPTPTPTTAPKPTETPSENNNTESKPSAPTATPKPTEAPKPTETPVPTGTVKKTLSFITRDSKGNELTVETTETSGSYVQWKKGSEAYYVPDGLEDKDISIVLDNQEEAWAWQEKYPDARYTTLTTTDANGNKTVRYVLDLDGYTSYDKDISREAYEKIINSDITLW